ncbi:hypothetical protein MNBD_GAMMA11-2021 [hydrothermal vent metagenome]|uniref:Uncharacterized protein n=1 Tax=hydrothermal vent metagenome TaxID=652676 RepID=A0A3B0XVS4_9ZZZZ
MNNFIKYLPTDNLYKFIALSGVVTSLASAYLYVSKVYEYKEKILEHKEELSFIAPITQIGFALGFFIACFGFYLWYTRIQRPIDKEISAKANISLIQSRREIENLDIVKYQEAYKALSKLEYQITMALLQVVNDLGPGKSFNANDIPTNEGYSELQMNVEFYIPEISDNLKNVNSLYLNFFKSIADFISEKDTESSKISQIVIKAFEISDKISHEITEMKESLKKLANNYEK